MTMTTDITELAQSLKAAAVRAQDATGEHASQRISSTAFRLEIEEFESLAHKPANILALLEALEKAQAQSSKWLEAYHKAVSIGARYEERIAELESFRTAYMEWSDKTDWVRTDRRFDVVRPLGKHLADVLKAYIEHLESRTVTVRMPPKIERDDADGWFMYNGGRVGGGAAEWYNKALDDVGAELAAAGIREAE